MPIAPLGACGGIYGLYLAVLGKFQISGNFRKGVY